VGPRNYVLDGGPELPTERGTCVGDVYLAPLARRTCLILASRNGRNKYHTAGASRSSDATCCQITLATCSFLQHVKLTNLLVTTDTASALRTVATILTIAGMTATNEAARIHRVCFVCFQLALK